MRSPVKLVVHGALGGKQATGDYVWLNQEVIMLPAARMAHAKRKRHDSRCSIPQLRVLTYSKGQGSVRHTGISPVPALPEICSLPGGLKAFYCDQCGSVVFFENVECVNCHSQLGFLPDVIDLSALSDDSPQRALAKPAQGRTYKACANGQQYHVCNWMIPAEDPNPLCASCRLNEVIPDLSKNENVALWQKMEGAKHRAIYSLLRLGLPLQSPAGEGSKPLRFRFLADTPGSPVLTGHSEGVITINLAEANDSERERRRDALHEPYRTLLGHFRHEIAHYYWGQLAARSSNLERFRALFGDERSDYAAALRRHYDAGPPADWQSHYVTAYAASHPWEDWAETTAHYFHVIDTLETAKSFGVALRPRHPDAKSLTTDTTRVAGFEADFEQILAAWVPLTLALNEFNRGMGLPDLYPFVLSAPAVEKLRLVHDMLRSASKSANRAALPARSPAE